MFIPTAVMVAREIPFDNVIEAPLEQVASCTSCQTTWNLTFYDRSQEGVDGFSPRVQFSRGHCGVHHTLFQDKCLPPGFENHFSTLGRNLAQAAERQQRPQKSSPGSGNRKDSYGSVHPRSSITSQKVLVKDAEVSFHSPHARRAAGDAERTRWIVAVP